MMITLGLLAIVGVLLASLFFYRRSQYHPTIQPMLSMPTPLKPPQEIPKMSLQPNQVHTEHAFNLAYLIDDCINVVKPNLENQGLTIKKHFSAQVSPMILSHYQHIQSIVNELLSNAVKFTEKGGIEIDVSLLKRKGRDCLLKIAVKDSGIGLDQAQYQAIFHRLNSPIKSTPEKPSGLKLVKRLAESLGGEIYLESVLQQGSTFSCILPIRLPAHTTQTNATRDAIAAVAAMDFVD